MKNIVLIGSGNLAEALARAISRTEGATLLQIFARNAKRGTALALENGALPGRQRRLLRVRQNLRTAGRQRCGDHHAGRKPAHTRRSRCGTYGRRHRNRGSSRTLRPSGRSLSPANLYPRPQRGFCQNTSFRRRKRRLLHLGARSVRPQSEPHGISCRLRPSRTPSPGRGFRLQFRQSPLRIGRRDFARDRTALRRTETPDRRNRSQSRRFGRSASGADRACRTRRPADVAAARSRTRSRSATVTNL